MRFARAVWLSIALWSAVGGAIASSAEAQAPAPVPSPPAANDVPPAATLPAPPPGAYTPQASPLAPPAGAPPAGYPSAPPVYYAPGYAPAYGTPAEQPPPGYYGIEAAPSDYPQPTYQAVQGRRPGPGSHEHEGFYLHLGGGFGAGGASYKDRIDSNVSKVRTRGVAFTLDVGIGGRIVENFILHGNLTFTFFDAKKKIDGVEDNGYDAINSTLWMLGAGGTYYVMPYNLYVTLVLGTGGFTESRDYETFGVTEVNIESSAGFAGALAIGKEWWVGGRGEWGIGAAIKGMLAVAPIEIANYKSTVTGHAVTLEFSATLN
ncbi:MAG TPA: hypothetical protein VFX59_28285 [Polyangiales bacterium]|nr:hypothetical protein [Polyangiales bacterium]